MGVHREEDLATSPLGLMEAVRARTESRRHGKVEVEDGKFFVAQKIGCLRKRLSKVVSTITVRISSIE